MLGNSVTQALFASANSIAVIPNVWAEWNYNNFIQPSITTSYGTSDLTPTTFNDSPNWSIQDSNGVYQNISRSNVYGKTTAFDSTGLKTLKFEYVNAGVAQVLSPGISLKPNSYYKFIFYAKAISNSTTGKVSYITGGTSSVTSNPGSDTIYYRIVGIGSSGQTSGPDTYGKTDLITVSGATKNSSTIQLNWKADTSAYAYQIYRTTDIKKGGYLIDVVSNTTTYTDDLSEPLDSNYIKTLSLPTFSSSIYMYPEINSTNTTNFYIKSSDFEKGSLQKSSNFIEIVGDTWKKIEVWFNTNVSDTSYKLYINTSTDYKNSNLLISDISLFELTETDFYFNDYYPTESPFAPYRPGESLVNTLLPDADKTITSTYSRMPSFAYKDLTSYTTQNNSVYQQILPSLSDKFKYYISHKSAYPTIYALYDQSISINKIVLKSNNQMSTILSGLITLYFVDGTNSTINVSAGQKNGCYIYYYDGSNWSSNPWTSPPTLTASGTFQNTVKIVGMSFKATSLQNLGNSETDNPRMHIVEFSPRLELDLSNYLISYDVTKQLSFENKSGFPFSYINSNSGTLNFSNLPVYSNNNLSSTIFENNSVNSPFYKLLRQGVKFTGFLTNPSFSTDLTEKIPLFYMYSDSWSATDIDTIQVNLFDFLKTAAQASESPVYACDKNNLFSIITTLLNISGISDYDWSALKSICDTSTNTTNFWCDTQKTVFDNLQELFLIHQIGAFVDEYGILRFKSLNNTLSEIKSSTFGANFAVTDVTSSAGNSTVYSPNIIFNSFNETVNPKIGKILLRYSFPKKYYSVDKDNSGINFSENNKITETSKAVWTEQDLVGLPSFELADSLRKNDRYIRIPLETYATGGNPRKMLGMLEGELIIGSEIVSYSGMEYDFYPYGDTNTSNKITKVVRSESDIEDGIKQVFQNNSSAISVEYHSKGTLLNVERGRYGTPISNHLVISDQDKIFNFNTYDSNFSSPGAAGIPDFNEGLHLNLDTYNLYYMYYPTNLSTAAKNNFFAIDFQIPIEGGHKNTFTNTQTQTSKSKNKNKKPSGSGWEWDKNKKHWTKTKTWTQYKDFDFGIYFNDDGHMIYSRYYVTISNRSNKNNANCTISVFNFDGQNYTYLLKNKPIKNIMDGQNSSESKQLTGLHRLSFFVDSKSAMVIALDNEQVAVISGTSIPNIQAGNSFGLFGRNMTQNNSIDIVVKELYADYIDTTYAKFDPQERYAFVNKNALNNIISNSPNNNNSYLWQAYPQVRGLKVYNSENYTLTPIDPQTAFFYPHIYGSTQSANGTNEYNEVLGPVIPSDLQISNLFTNPFNVKFAIANNTNELVYLNNPSDQSIVPISVHAHYQELSKEKIIQRITDPSNQSNSIELQSKWLGSENDVNQMLSLLSKSLETFYSTYQINIFGNPLIQVGDYAKLTYSLKRIGYDKADANVQPIYCLVTDVKQSFLGGVGETTLTLNPIII